MQEDVALLDKVVVVGYGTKVDNPQVAKRLKELRAKLTK
jgi:hypothetical protein